MPVAVETVCAIQVKLLFIGKDYILPLFTPASMNSCIFEPINFMFFGQGWFALHLNVLEVISICKIPTHSLLRHITPCIFFDDSGAYYLVASHANYSSDHSW